MPHFPSLSQEKKYPEPFWFMLHRLIGGAEFLFLHLFVTIFAVELYWISLAHK
jgi:hypothetical protein